MPVNYLKWKCEECGRMNESELTDDFEKGDEVTVVCDDCGSESEEELLWATYT